MGDLFLWAAAKVLLEGVGLYWLEGQSLPPPPHPCDTERPKGLTTTPPLHRTYFPFSCSGLNQLAAVVSKW